jgi:hypothetical protein
MTSHEQSLSGEARLKQRRNRLVRYLALTLFAGFIGGVVTGWAGRLATTEALPVPLFVGLWLAVLVAFVWFTRDYFRRVDELDLLDNLWASTIAVYAFFAAAGSWFVFHDIGIAPPPSGEALGLFTFAALLIAYAARKIGVR